MLLLARIDLRQCYGRVTPSYVVVRGDAQEQLQVAGRFDPDPLLLMHMRLTTRRSAALQRTIGQRDTSAIEGHLQAACAR